MSWKKYFYLILAVVLFAFVGCIDYENEFSLNNDGSGKVHIHYWMTVDAYNQMKSGEGKSDPASEVDVTKKYSGEGLTVSGFKTYDVTDKKEAKEAKEGEEAPKPVVTKHVELDVSFKNITNLSNCPEFKFWKFTYSASDKIVFSAVVTPENKEGVNEGANYYTAIFNFPGPVTTFSENGTFDKSKPNQIIWKIDVGKLNKEGWTLTAESQLGKPGNPLPILIVFGVIVLIIIIAIVAGKKKGGAAPAPAAETKTEE